MHEYLDTFTCWEELKRLDQLSIHIDEYRFILENFISTYDFELARLETEMSSGCLHPKIANELYHTKIDYDALLAILYLRLSEISF